MFFEFQRKRDPGNPTADNADLGPDHRSLFKLARVDEHIV